MAQKLTVAGIALSVCLFAMKYLFPSIPRPMAVALTAMTLGFVVMDQLDARSLSSLFVVSVTAALAVCLDIIWSLQKRLRPSRMSDDASSNDKPSADISSLHLVPVNDAFQPPRDIERRGEEIDDLLILIDEHLLPLVLRHLDSCGVAPSSHEEKHSAGMVVQRYQLIAEEFLKASKQIDEVTVRYPAYADIAQLMEGPVVHEAAQTAASAIRRLEKAGQIHSDVWREILSKGEPLNCVQKLHAYSSWLTEVREKLLHKRETEARGRSA
jgi:hypothetical protein